MRLPLLLLVFGVVAITLAQLRADEAVVEAEVELSRLPLHLHKPGQKILAICPGVERDILRKEFLERGGEIDFAEEYDPDREDYSDYYAIISGSNQVDFFHKKEASAFQHIVDWVEDGGHMFFFGAFNGRNFHIAKPFGLTTGYVHNRGFDPVPGRTGALFYGHNASVPEDRRLQSYGHLGLERPYVRMLNNISTDSAGGWKKLISWPHGRGRVSATMVEPRDGGRWIVPIVADWIRRGAPVVMSDVQDGPAIADSISLRQSGVSNGMILTSSERESLAVAVEERLAKLEPEQRNEPQYLLELTETYVLEKEQTYDHWLKRGVHLELVAKLAAEQVRLDLAFDAIDQAGRWVYVDGPSEKAELLKTALAHADQSNAELIVEAALNELPKLQELYLYDVAASFAKSALSAAVVSEDEYLIELASRQLVRVEQRQQAMADNADLLAAWKKSPEDPDLLEQVGKFLAFQMDDWKLGLECLAKSENIVLGDLARSSLDLPKEATLVIRIGDRWRDIAETRDKIEKENIERFVREMYRDLGDELRDVSVADRRRATDFIEAGPSVEDAIHISLTLDGYGLLTITPDEASWETKTGLEPSEIKVGRQTWSKVSEPLSNAGIRRFIDPRVDLSTARLGSTVGRGLVRFVDRERDKVTIRINDLPVGEDRYEFEITFGK